MHIATPALWWLLMVSQLTQCLVSFGLLLQEDSFHLVDSKPVKAPKFGQRRFQQNRQQQAQRTRDGRLDGGKGEERKKVAQQKRNPWQQPWQREPQRVSASRDATTVPINSAS